MSRSPTTRRAWLVAFTIGAILICRRETSAFEAFVVKESRGSPGHEAGFGGCSLPPSLNGTCANLSYYNSCSGYIWIFTGTYAGEGHGTRFDGPCVSPDQRVTRGITYFRATVPSYQQTVDVYLDADFNNDGCPDGLIASDLSMDPGERWNCSGFDVCVPVAQGQSLLVRAVGRGTAAPAPVTDGPYTETCDPIGLARSFYYPAGGGCYPWIINSPTGRNDNFLTWLVIDTDAACGTATEASSWGQVKGLFR